MTDSPTQTTTESINAPDGNFAVGVDSIGKGFKGSITGDTPDDGNPSSIEPQTPLPDNATETEKELVEENK